MCGDDEGGAASRRRRHPLLAASKELEHQQQQQQQQLRHHDCRTTSHSAGQPPPRLGAVARCCDVISAGCDVTTAPLGRRRHLAARCRPLSLVDRCHTGDATVSHRATVQLHAATLSLKQTKQT